MSSMGKRPSNNNTSNGISFCGLLTIVFVACKLTGHIDWPWILVLSPIWAPFFLGIILLFILVFVFGSRPKRAPK